MYRQHAEHAYSRPPQHQGAISHDEHSQTFYSSYPQQAAYSRAPTQPDPAYYQGPPPPKQQSIYGPPLAHHQHSHQQKHSQRPIRSRPIPPSQFKEDPAFSSDPLSNPLAGFTNFVMNSSEEIVPGAGNQGYVSPQGTSSKRDPSAIYAYPPAPPVSQTPANAQYRPSSIHPHASTGSHHSRPPSEADSFYAHSPFTSAPNGSYPRDPRGSNDASSVHLAYDEPNERVIPPEPSSAARQSYYSKYAESEDGPRPEEHSSSSRKLHKARKADEDRRQASQASLARSVNTSYSSSKSSSASSFARAQSGDVSIASSKSKSSLRVVNPDPYAIFMPQQHSPDTSASSISSSSEGPHTPPSSHGHFDPNAPYPASHSDKGYLDDKRLRREKSREAALDQDEHDHEHKQPAAEAPPAYTPLPTPTETVAVAGPSDDRGSKVEYGMGPVQVTLTPDGISLDPLQPSVSQASASSSSSKRTRREPADNVERPTLPQGIVSAPELHMPPQREDPARPATVPIAVPFPASAASAPPLASTPSSAPSAAGSAAPPLVKTRSRKPSVATPPKDLDKIDELDETDPLGVAWHMPGPYDAIPKLAKASQSGFPSGGGGAPKIFAAQADGDGQGGSGGGGPSNGRRKLLAVDPNTTSFPVKPGQIFPSIAPPMRPPPPFAAPAPSQAPFSPTVRQAYVNNHMVPGVAPPEPPPPLFSPTPSEMARQHSARDLRRQRRERERESIVVNQPNLSGVGTAYASTLSEGHSMSGSSGLASSASGHGSAPRSNEHVQGMQPPMQMQREQHMHQHYQQQQQQQQHAPHRPHPHPVQPQPPMHSQEQRLKAQSSRNTLSRSRSAPNSAPPSGPPSSTPSSGSSHSSHQQMLSNEPPPTPDIQLPPPPPPPSHPIPPPPASVRSAGAPSVHSSAHSSATNRSQMPPSNRYMPKKLVMPTPLQPMQPLPGQAPSAQTQPQAPAAGARAVPAGYAGSASRGVPLKHSQTLPPRSVRPQAQEIPMSHGKNVLRKHKENGREAAAAAPAAERMARSQSSRAGVSASASTTSLGRGLARGEAGATAVWEGRVVVVPEEKKKSGGIGALFGFGGSSSSSREKEREREKERVLAERAREREREREAREREKRKLSKPRR